MAFVLFYKKGGSSFPPYVFLISYTFFTSFFLSPFCIFYKRHEWLNDHDTDAFSLKFAYTSHIARSFFPLSLKEKKFSCWALAKLLICLGYPA
jgi:hypothetical protein